jgi:hypothetical protein
MGRIYEIPIVPTASPAAAFDAWEVLAASGKPFRLHEVVIGHRLLHVRLRRLVRHPDEGHERPVRRPHRRGDEHHPGVGRLRGVDDPAG